MLRPRRASHRHGVWALLVVVPAAVFLTLQTNSGLNPMTVAPDQHFYVVSLASAVCLALACLAVRASIEAGNARVYLMAIGFLLMAGLFAVHGLTTPGYIVDARYGAVTGFTGHLALLVGSFFLALSVAPIPGAVVSAVSSKRCHVVGLGVVAASLAGFALLSLLAPGAIPPRFMSGDWFPTGATYGVFVFSGIAVIVYAALYFETAAPVYGAVAVGAALMIEAQIAMHWGELWRWSWWMHHLQLLGAFAVMLSFPFAGLEAAKEGVGDAVESPAGRSRRRVVA